MHTFRTPTHPPAGCTARWRSAHLLLVLAIVAAACSSGDGPTLAAPDGGSSEAQTAATTAVDITLTEADITFLRGMVPHHAQAVDMAELVEGRTAHPEELGALADAIIGTQQVEIDAMNALLEQAGEDPVGPAADADGMDHGGMDDGDGMAMDGMMSAEDMAVLADADGDVFDGMFLEMMIAHHQGAITSAEQVLDQPEEGGNADVRALAEAIITAQEAEIDQMRGWQQDWSV